MCLIEWAFLLSSTSSQWLGLKISYLHGHLYIHPPIHLSVHRSTCPPVYLSIFPSARTYALAVSCTFCICHPWTSAPSLGAVSLLRLWKPDFRKAKQLSVIMSLEMLHRRGVWAHSISSVCATSVASAVHRTRGPHSPVSSLLVLWGLILHNQSHGVGAF